MVTDVKDMIRSQQDGGRHRNRQRDVGPCERSKGWRKWFSKKFVGCSGACVHLIYHTFVSQLLFPSNCSQLFNRFYQSNITNQYNWLSEITHQTLFRKSLKEQKYSDYRTTKLIVAPGRARQLSTENNFSLCLFLSLLVTLTLLRPVLT